VKYVGLLISIVIIVHIGTDGVCSTDVDPQVRDQLDILLTAVQNGDYNAFIANGTAMFKESITQQIFKVVSVQMNWRLEQGYEAIYLDTLNQQGCLVYVWKLVFTDGGDDVLAKLVIKDDKVAGFWLQ